MKEKLHDCFNNLIKNSSTSRIFDTKKPYPSLTTRTKVFEMLQEQHLKVVQVERVKDLSVEDFMKKYFIPQKPVIIVDEVQNWPASQNWSLSYLVQKCGLNKVSVRQKTSSNEYRIGQRNTYREILFKQ